MLEDDRIAIWYLDINAGRMGRWARRVSEGERRRAAKFRRAEDAQRFLGSRALTRSAVATCIDVEPTEIEFSRVCEYCGNPSHGRPIVTGGHDSIALSATRAGQTVAVALSTSRIGLDAESRHPDLDELVDSAVFSDQDRAWLREEAVPSLSDRVLLLWVVKEAIGKLSGHGLVHADRILAGPSTHGWSDGEDALGRSCWVARVDLPGTAAAAIATFAPPSPIRMRDARTLGL